MNPAILYDSEPGPHLRRCPVCGETPIGMGRWTFICDGAHPSIQAGSGLSRELAVEAWNEAAESCCFTNGNGDEVWV